MPERKDKQIAMYDNFRALIDVAREMTPEEVKLIDERLTDVVKTQQDDEALRKHSPPPIPGIRPRLHLSRSNELARRNYEDAGSRILTNVARRRRAKEQNND